MDFEATVDPKTQRIKEIVFRSRDFKDEAALTNMARVIKEALDRKGIFSVQTTSRKFKAKFTVSLKQ